MVSSSPLSLSFATFLEYAPKFVHMSPKCFSTRATRSWISFACVSLQTKVTTFTPQLWHDEWTQVDRHWDSTMLTNQWV